MNPADRVELDDQGLAGLDVNAHLVTHIKTVEKDRGGQE